MSAVALLKKVRRYGIRKCITRLSENLKNNRMKELDYFKNKNGLEIGGPSGAFSYNGYIPVYKIKCIPV